MNNKLRVLFMGTPDFALPSLEMLYDKFNICAVFCQPDKVNARGNKVLFSPIKEFAIQHNIPVCQPETLKDKTCLQLLKSFDPEIIVVAAYGKILPKYILDYPKFGCVNVHGSLLPKYRGASPIQASILNGDDQTGITIMKMGVGLDDGDIILQRMIKIGEYETAGELFDRMSVLGAEVLSDAIDGIINGTAQYVPQDENLSSHVSMINKSMGKLDFSQSSKQIKRLVYGLNPWPSAFVEVSSGIIKIHKVIKGNVTDRKPGTFVSITKNGIEIACGDNNTVIITEIQKQGKKKMDAYSFSLGIKINVDSSIYDL